VGDFDRHRDAPLVFALDQEGQRFAQRQLAFGGFVESWSRIAVSLSRDKAFSRTAWSRS
jgi:hypothetical protein